MTRTIGILGFDINGIWPWTNIPTTLYIHVSLQFLCDLYIDPTLLYTYIKNSKLELFLTCYCHICAKTNMPLRCHIKWHMPNTLCADIRQWCQYIHIIWILLQSIMWPKALVCIHFTLLTYAPEQICLPHCTCMSHCTTTVAYI